MYYIYNSFNFFFFFNKYLGKLLDTIIYYYPTNFHIIKNKLEIKILNQVIFREIGDSNTTKINLKIKINYTDNKYNFWSNYCY